MERKEYLDRIKAYAVAKAAGNQRDLERVKVQWRNRKDAAPISCYPWKYELSYDLSDPNGKPIHTAVLLDCTANCLYDVPLDAVEKERDNASPTTQ